MDPLSPRDPRTVGEFQLRARLGSGGMGRVYLGYSPAGRAVAVKVVREELADDPQFRRRFAREVESAKSVSGVYTAPVVGAGLDDDPPWFATAFVPGPSLADVVSKHGPLSEQSVWRLAAGLTEALGAVHESGLVHRDIKPANVLLAADGPHLIDFGISRALDGTSLTATGVVVGTPGYMSPEQAEGDPSGRPSDVFSLGALLAYAATGRAPFGGGSAAAVLYRVVRGQADLEGVPERLRGFISSCMTTQPSKRPDLKSLAASVPRTADAGPGAALTSYWPSDIGEIIRTSQPELPGDDATTAMPGAGPTEPASAKSPGAPARPAPARHAPVPPPPARPPAPYPSRDPRQGYQAPPYPPGPPPRAWDNVPRRGAATLMRVGALLSLVNMIVGLADIGALRRSFLRAHPEFTGRAVGAFANTAAGAVIITDVIAVILWLMLARSASRGRPPRTAGTVLFVMYTAAKLGTIWTPGFAAGKVLDIAIWLVGLLALIAIWRRPPARRAY